MFLSQLFSADTASATPAKDVASKQKDSELAGVSGSFTETLQGAIATESNAVDKDGEPVVVEQQVSDGQAAGNGAQDIEKAELLAEGNSEESAVSAASGKAEKEQVTDTDTQGSGDVNASAGTAALLSGATSSSVQDASSSMSEGEELLQRLSASRSQLGGGPAAGQTADGKMLPPGGSSADAASGAGGTAALAGANAQEGAGGKEGAEGKDQAIKELIGKDLASKEFVAKDGVAKDALLKDAMSKEGALAAEGKSAKVDSAGKMALTGGAVSGGELAELKTNQGASPLSSALLGQQASTGSLKGTFTTKGSGAALSAASMDGALNATSGEALATGLAETQGAHGVQRTAAAGMLVTEGDKPGNAQPPLLLTKEQAGDQLADRVQMMMSKNLKHVDIRLDPPELGKLQIKLSMNNDQASVQITVANQQSRDLVEQAMPRLRELLHQQGLQLAQSSVQQDTSRQFAGGSQQQTNGQPGDHSQQGGQSQQGRQGSGQSHDFGDGATAQAHTADYWMAAPKDGVDYYA